MAKIIIFFVIIAVIGIYYVFNMIQNKMHEADVATAKFNLEKSNITLCKIQLINPKDFKKLKMCNIIFEKDCQIPSSEKCKLWREK